jgi:hypothetical protein
LKPKLIKEEDVPVVNGILDTWTGKLTWDKFSDAVANRLGINSISSCTLMGYPWIKQAFRRRKETLREAKANAISEIGDVTVDSLIRENEALRGQILHLKSEYEVREKVFKETFIRWQYNLSQMPGVDLSKLDEPLEGIDRANRGG